MSAGPIRPLLRFPFVCLHYKLSSKLCMKVVSCKGNCAGNCSCVRCIERSVLYLYCVLSILELEAQHFLICVITIHYYNSFFHHMPQSRNQQAFFPTLLLCIASITPLVITPESALGRFLLNVPIRCSTRASATLCFNLFHTPHSLLLFPLRQQRPWPPPLLP
jgi:hypothetical protein